MSILSLYFPNRFIFLAVTLGSSCEMHKPPQFPTCFPGVSRLWISGSQYPRCNCDADQTHVGLSEAGEDAVPPCGRQHSRSITASRLFHHPGLTCCTEQFPRLPLCRHRAAALGDRVHRWLGREHPGPGAPPLGTDVVVEANCPGW